MSTSGECCGWLGWAELAGIGADGAPLRSDAQAEPAKPSVATTSRRLPFITALLRRGGRDGVPQ